MKTYTTYAEVLEDYDAEVLTADEFKGAVAALPRSAMQALKDEIEGKRPKAIKQKTLREKIQAAIDRHPDDSGAASISVCKVLEREIGLAGNGWFDDDPEMQAAL